MIDKHIVRKRFDRHAHEYDQYADVQRLMIDRLLMQPLLQDYVREIRASCSPSYFHKVLDLGCGTGLLSQAFLETCGPSAFTLLDLSPHMLSCAARKLTAVGHKETVHDLIERDAEQWLAEQQQACIYKSQLNDRYSIILSSAALQWFEAPAVAVSRLISLLDNSGIIAFATFLPGTLQELHHACAVADAIQSKPIAARGQTYYSSTEWQAFFANLHEDIQYTWQEEAIVMHYADAKQLLRHVRKMGAANALHDREHAVSRAWLSAMEQAYRDQCSDPSDAIQATYQVGYGVIRLGEASVL